MRMKIDPGLIIYELKKAAIPVLPLKDIRRKLHIACASLSHRHPAYEKLAAALALKELYDETPATFEESFDLLQQADPPILSETYIIKTRDMISSGHIKGIIMPERDEELSQ
ncbi:hypothetical protein CVT26_015859 [Gymnopilus dilepis]|uniref:Uncharacterized protein n=1 Tax=Gymnopilus dilepis TaxID=231916 RepID=A0A409WXF8_9AGAR|nr:hypothetical protein CVT26_015859 [Gymnopilus dilepis]